MRLWAAVFAKYWVSWSSENGWKAVWVAQRSSLGLLLQPRMQRAVMGQLQLWGPRVEMEREMIIQSPGATGPPYATCQHALRWVGVAGKVPEVPEVSREGLVLLLLCCCCWGGRGSGVQVCFLGRFANSDSSGKLSELSKVRSLISPLPRREQAAENVKRIGASSDVPADVARKVQQVPCLGDSRTLGRFFWSMSFCFFAASQIQTSFCCVCLTEDSCWNWEFIGFGRIWEKPQPLSSSPSSSAHLLGQL